MRIWELYCPSHFYSPCSASPKPRGGTLQRVRILIVFSTIGIENWPNYLLNRSRFIIKLSGKEEEAQKALQWLRGPSADIRTELNEIKNTHLLSTKYATKVKDLLGKTYLKPLLTSLGLMFFQQFSGINAVIFYTVNIFEMSGSSVDSNLATIIVGLVRSKF